MISNMEKICLYPPIGRFFGIHIRFVIKIISEKDSKRKHVKHHITNREGILNVLIGLFEGYRTIKQGVDVQEWI